MRCGPAHLPAAHSAPREGSALFEPTDNVELKASGCRIVDIELLAKGLSNTVCCARCVNKTMTALRRAHDKRMAAYNAYLDSGQRRRAPTAAAC